ncbi:hypothetical protein [Nocardia terpenica]|uniref:hypothetical protein n=1 Tax=Nocardia terpenica TaxID=455432 RepID=UPI0002F34193|nr:hypothetical protein [Nocardia terpenica]NQE89949.1 hypothetical protein [Nocardia terpenica]
MSTHRVSLPLPQRIPHQRVSHIECEAWELLGLVASSSVPILAGIAVGWSLTSWAVALP